MSCDIIIPVWNKKELTMRCIESVVENTHYPYRLIIIDNASNQTTSEYLKSLKQNKQLEVKIIRNSKNLGNTRAVNQGIEVSEAPFVCILDNDTIVCRGWLSEMVSIAEADESIGIVNPSSNTLGTNPKSELKIDIEECAEQCKKQQGQWVELGACVGFCSLIKREVIEKIGGWDEDFSPGYFDDTEYSYRAYKAGYKSVCAKGAYVYHNEHASFKDRNLEKVFKEKRELFYKKVGRTKRILYILTKENMNYFNRLKKETYKLANNLNWVRIFIKSSVAKPDIINHGRIGLIPIATTFFRLHCIFNILLRKKKYTKIYVDDANLYNILNKLKAFHKSKVEIIKP